MIYNYDLNIYDLNIYELHFKIIVD